MANMLLAYGTQVAKGTLFDGSWAASMPLANLQDRQLGVLARSVGLTLAATQFKVGMPANTPVQVVAIANHNFSRAAKYRIRAADDPAFPISPEPPSSLEIGEPLGMLLALANSIAPAPSAPSAYIYDSGWRNVWPAVFSTSDLEWEADNFWDGQYLDEDLDGYTRTMSVVLPTVVRPLYWWFEFDDQLNAAGYIQAGRLFMAPSWTPIRNADFGATLGWKTDTEVQKSISGAKFFDAKTPYRSAMFRFSNLTESEAMSYPFEIMRRSGIDKEVFYMWDPEDTKEATRRQFLGTLATLNPLEFPDGFINGNEVDGDFRVSVPMEVEELVA